MDSEFKSNFKANLKLGWIVGSLLGDHPLFAVLPFLFPKAADAIADKLSEKVGGMLDPSTDKAD